MSEHREGGETLTRWMDRTGETPVTVAAGVHASKAAVYMWKAGDTRPDLARALRLEEHSKGDVPIEAWGYERALIDTMRDVVERRDAATESEAAAAGAR